MSKESLENFKLKRRQSGQSMIFVIGILAAIMIMIAYTHNAYTISNEKVRLQNTVDAATYSAAVLEARQLNFLAYTNRAMIANQVAVGQLVGFVSWSYMIEAFFAFLAELSSFFAPLKAAMESVEYAVTMAVNVIEPIAEVSIFTLDSMLGAIELSQHLFVKAVPLLAQEVVKEVIEENDATVDGITTSLNALALAKYGKESYDFTRRFSPDRVRNGNSGSDDYKENFSRMEEMRDAVMRSRDDFTRSRTYKFIDVGFLRLYRYGSSDLTGEDRKHEYGAWTAMDVISLEAREISGFKLKWKRNRGGTGGTATASRSEENIDPRKHNRSNDYGGAWDSASRAAEEAVSPTLPGSPNRSFDATINGLRMHYGLAVDGLIQRGPGLNLMLSKPTGDIKTTKRIGFNSGELNLEQHATGTPGNRLYAFAGAEAFFARVNDANGMPKGLAREDSRREYGSLYNPYWHARLKPLTATEKTAMKAAVTTGLGG